MSRFIIAVHFGNIDALATSVFEKDKISEVPDAILHGILDGSAIHLTSWADDALLVERWSRLSCFAKDGSPFLRSCFTCAVKKCWLSILGMTKSELTEDQRLDIDFILAGMVAIISISQKETTFRNIDSFINRDLGQGVVKLLNSMMNDRQRTVYLHGKE